MTLSPCGSVEWVPCWALAGVAGASLGPSAHLNALFLCSEETTREACCQLSLLLPDRRSRGVESASLVVAGFFASLSLLFL